MENVFCSGVGSHFHFNGWAVSPMGQSERWILDKSVSNFYPVLIEKFATGWIPAVAYPCEMVIADPYDISLTGPWVWKCHRIIGTIAGR